MLDVSTSSVSHWVRDIELTRAQQNALLARNPAYNRQLRGQAVMSARRRAERRAHQEHGRSLARRGMRCTRLDARCIGPRARRVAIRSPSRNPTPTW
jgi:hypothetical protein